MTFSQLTYVVALATHGHFRKAAAHCNVAQPTLSMQIRKLEAELGIQLFDRDRKPIQPTPQGRRIIEQARIVLKEVEVLQALTGQAVDAPTRPLHIGMPPSLAASLLPLLASYFARRHPGIGLVLEEHAPPTLQAALHPSGLDAALVSTPLADRHLVRKKLFEEPLAAYVSRRHRFYRRKRIRARDLNRHELWLPGPDSELREQILQGCGLNPESDIPGRSFDYRGDSFEILKRFVEEGDGLTILPWLTLATGPHQAHLVKPFAPPVPTRPVYLLYHKAQHRKNILALFEEAVQHITTPLLPLSTP